MHSWWMVGIRHHSQNGNHEGGLFAIRGPRYRLRTAMPFYCKCETENMAVCGPIWGKTTGGRPEACRPSDGAAGSSGVGGQRVFWIQERYL